MVDAKPTFSLLTSRTGDDKEEAPESRKLRRSRCGEAMANLEGLAGGDGAGGRTSIVGSEARIDITARAHNSVLRVRLKGISLGCQGRSKRWIDQVRWLVHDALLSCCGYG
jgi:hypothetical protein